MKITLNGRQTDIAQSAKLKSIIKEFSKKDHTIIAEVNGHIIKAPFWESTDILEGDSIELLNFVGGG